MLTPQSGFFALGVSVVLSSWPGMAAEKKIDFTVDGQKVIGTLSLPDGVATPSAVLLLHGFTGSRDELEIPAVKEGIFERASRMWANKGIASLRIDFRGNGESEGSFEDMTLDAQVKDALAALDYLAASGEVDKDRLALVGWSMGGAVGSAVAGAHPAQTHVGVVVGSRHQHGQCNHLCPGAGYGKAGPRQQRQAGDC